MAQGPFSLGPYPATSTRWAAPLRKEPSAPSPFFLPVPESDPSHGASPTPPHPCPQGRQCLQDALVYGTPPIIQDDCLPPVSGEHGRTESSERLCEPQGKRSHGVINSGNQSDCHSCRERLSGPRRDVEPNQTASRWKEASRLMALVTLTVQPVGTDSSLQSPSPER